MFKSRDKQELMAPTDDGHEDRGHAGSISPESPESPERDAGERITGRFNRDPVVQVRWVPWLLAVLVIVCLLLAAWVWFEILHL
jgi:hypothetical protein